MRQRTELPGEESLQWPEVRLLLALLERKFPGSAELREQARVAEAETIMMGDDPALLFHFTTPPRKANVLQRVPVECETLEGGPRRVHCLLHVVDGQLDLLEFLRENGDPVEEIPTPDAVRIIINGSSPN